METISLVPWTDTTPFIQAMRENIRSRVSKEHWQAALEAGHALSLEQAIELVVRLVRQIKGLS